MTENISEINNDDLYEHFKIIADPKQQPLRLDKFLHNRLSSKSRTRIQNAINVGNITVNGKKIKPSYLVRPGDILQLLLPNPPYNKELKAENIPVNIVYEDDDLIVVNKDAGMVVHPGFGNYNGTLVNAILYHLSIKDSADSLSRCGLVHRIDKNTSGLLVIAKSEEAMASLAKQFFDHTIKRHYMTLVWGNIEKDATIDGYISRNIKNRKIMQVHKEEEKGKRIVTHYKVLKNFYYVTLLDVHLETGRTHQIRAHMKHIGHPIFGDSQYGGMTIVKGPNTNSYKKFVNSCFNITTEQMLHAKSLGFIHPKTNEYMHFDSALPNNFKEILTKWEDMMSNSNN